MKAQAEIFAAIDSGEYHAKRPTDMLLRQLAANRGAARYRNPETGQRHHGHLPVFRPHFVNDIILLRRELRARKAAP